ncbi:MAG: universal stress protein [Cyanobacteriota bacterium]
MFKNLLIATDRQDGLQRFGKCLVDLHSGGLERITFVHSIPWQEDNIRILEDITPEIRLQQTQLQELLSDVPSGLEVQVLVQLSKPVDLILEAIQRYGSDLLITGMDTRNLLTEKLFGSTTINLLPKLKIPVMVMRPQLIAVFTLEELRLRSRHLFRCILVPFDFEEPRRQLLTHLGHLLSNTSQSQSQCQSVTLLYVIDPSARHNQGVELERLKRKAEADLAQVIAPLAKQIHAVQLRTLVRVGSPLQEILATAADEDMTAIATASPNVGSFWEWSVRSLTGEILRRSWHPVLFFPRGTLAK